MHSDATTMLVMPMNPITPGRPACTGMYIGSTGKGTTGSGGGSDGTCDMMAKAYRGRPVYARLGGIYPKNSNSAISQ